MASETKTAHTPGPLRACEHGAETPAVYRPDGTMLAMLFWPTHPPEETARAEAEIYATADLFAAAPDLLAALEQTEDRLEEMAVMLDRARRAMEDSNARCRDLAAEVTDILNEERDFITEARAVIAKATGATP